MSLVEGGLSTDTFDYAQGLARVDGNEDQFYVYLLSHDRRAERASLPFPLKLCGPWYVALKRASFRTQLSHQFCLEVTDTKGSSKNVLLERRLCANWFDLFGQLRDEVVDSKVL